MNGPQKNRLHDYEAGWLTLLVEMGVATMTRVAQRAIDKMNERRQRRRAARNRRRNREQE